MKVYLILWVCVQSLTSPLEETCVQDVLSQEFTNVQSCLRNLDALGAKMTSVPDVHITGFCTTKQYEPV
tara:strand:- start:1257 stop:1463 length:207 start_codon:yes stop_codon:yes gene_type:complete